MTWYQILLLFVGAPVALFVLITVVVLRFTSPRVPDGLRRAAGPRDGGSPSFDDEDASDDDTMEERVRPDDYYDE